jgi:hypothetical protein
MAHAAAYSGLRQGELFALTAVQLAPESRVITVDRKVVEICGKLYVEAPKGRKYRSTIYPVRTPDGYPLAEKLAARAGQVRAEMEAGRNPPGLMFPSPRREPATNDGLVYACSMVMLYAAGSSRTSQTVVSASGHRRAPVAGPGSSRHPPRRGGAQRVTARPLRPLVPAPA